MENPSQSQFAELAQRFELKLIIQFGSTVTGQLLHAESDIDLAVLSQHALTFEQRFELMNQLASLYNVEDTVIDVIDLRIASSMLMLQVVTKGLVRFDADNHQFDKFYIRAMKQYIDEEYVKTIKPDYGALCPLV